MTTATKPTGTAVAKKPMTFDDLLEKMKPELVKILPKYLTPERMLALITLAATKTPKLKECTPLSLWNAVMYAARLGLEIGQHAHLVPFKNSRANVTEAVMIPDYRGLIKLAKDSGEVKHVEARVVYAEDDFDYQLGTDPWIRHKPKLDGDRSDEKIVAVYAVALLANGERVFDEPVSKKEVDAVRSRSRAANDGPWVTDYPMMARKTGVKRIAKYLPQTPKLAAAIEADNRAETGEIGTVSDIIDSSESLNQQVAESTKQKAEDLKTRLAESTGGERVPEPPPPQEPVEVQAEEKAPASGKAKGGQNQKMMF